ncbi:MAG: hypothetical protein JSW41_04025 [Candidatus Aenigmatarchaeota archaeon]|nr:MAG: hypothetical protein JSW41_04025 [Candidatus Aenigmarchaeota archaeon]
MKNTPVKGLAQLLIPATVILIIQTLMSPRVIVMHARMIMVGALTGDVVERLLVIVPQVRMIVVVMITTRIE